MIGPTPFHPAGTRRRGGSFLLVRPHPAVAALHRQPRTDLKNGLSRTADWFRSLPDKQAYELASKKFGLDTRHSVTAVVACYKDVQAIPVMYERLKNTFAGLNIDYEIIFVNDCSPDDSEEVIRAITRNDRRVIGISHSRNFGSQAAFMSGLGIASKNSCVLLDGDLQDPPELIEQFVALWREGFDVVFGRRVKRVAPLFMQFAYKAFYRVFDFFSYVRVPHDAGDFSLLDRRVVQAILRFPERDLFLRGVRAFVGFRQTGVDYVRPERMFGRSTNNLIKNLGWAKRGILSFSNTPLNMLSTMGTLLLALTVLWIRNRTGNSRRLQRLALNLRRRAHCFVVIDRAVPTVIGVVRIVVRYSIPPQRRVIQRQRCKIQTQPQASPTPGSVKSVTAAVAEATAIAAEMTTTAMAYRGSGMTAAARVLRGYGRAHRQCGDAAGGEQGQQTVPCGIFHNVTHCRTGDS